MVNTICMGGGRRAAGEEHSLCGPGRDAHNVTQRLGATTAELRRLPPGPNTPISTGAL
ncbi:MAG: hypothetical protein V2G43_03735 [bacterium JZ-2024 1]